MLGPAAARIHSAAPVGRLGLSLVLFTAIGLPWQISYNMLPSPTFLNELVAFLGWAAVLARLSSKLDHRPVSMELRAFAAAMALLVAGTLIQLTVGKTRIPAVAAHWSYFALAACATAWAGYQFESGEPRRKFIDAWAVCWLAGCLLSFLAGLVQYLQLPVSWYAVAPPYDWGRIGGNIRQPNHFATLMVIGLPCSLWLVQRRIISPVVAALSSGMIAFAVVISASRSGFLSLILLLSWVLLASRERRVKLVGTAAGIAAVVSAAALLALDIAHVLPWYGGTRIPHLGATSDGGRLHLWADALELIRQNPWSGVGVGQFAFYLLLSDLPHRSNTLFTNAHNLPLHLTVEFGLPLAGIAFGLFAWAIWRVRRVFAYGVGQFAAWSLLPVAVHSMFEFPLWYAYMLLPAAFLLGLALSEAQESAPPLPRKGGSELKWAAMAIAAGILVAVPHYMALAAVYAPGGDRDTLKERLQTLHSAYIYSHWVAATMLDGIPYQRISADPDLLVLFERYSRFFLSDKMMARYALALAEQGRLAEAHRLVFVLRSRASGELTNLQEYSRRHATQGAKALTSVIEDPSAPQVSAGGFQ